MDNERRLVKDQLRSAAVRPSKERGQNFLIDPHCIDQIIQFGKPREGEDLLEIGPGLGALTAALYPYRPLTVIEIEEEFCNQLSKKFPELDVVNEDVRAVDLSSLGEQLVVFGNLPYSFSTDIIFHLVDNAHCVKRAVLLLQKEFAQRLAADPGGRTYGTLTISCQLFANVRLGPIFSGDSFQPTAKVDSQVVQMNFLPEPRYKVDNIFWFKRLVQAAFFKRRRKLLNSLQASEAFSDLNLKEILAELNISAERRAETLSVEEYATLSNRISDLVSQ